MSEDTLVVRRDGFLKGQDQGVPVVKALDRVSAPSRSRGTAWAPAFRWRPDGPPVGDRAVFDNERAPVAMVTDRPVDLRPGFGAGPAATQKVAYPTTVPSRKFTPTHFGRIVSRVTRVWNA